MPLKSENPNICGTGGKGLMWVSPLVHDAIHFVIHSLGNTDKFDFRWYWYYTQIVIVLYNLRNDFLIRQYFLRKWQANDINTIII